MTGASILSCCCDAAPCTGLVHAQQPDTITVSVTYEVTWQTNVWRLSSTLDRDTLAAPSPPGACPTCGGFRLNSPVPIFPYNVCDFCLDNQAGGAQCARSITRLCVTPTADIESTYTATQLIQASGTLFKTPSACWTGGGCGGTFNNRVLYRGQVFFEYDFASDFPDSASASGAFTPTSPQHPTLDSSATGMLVELRCNRSPTASARGLCKPYTIYGVDTGWGGVSCSQNVPPTPVEELEVVGPHLQLRCRVLGQFLQNNQPQNAPAVDLGGPLSLIRFADGIPTCGAFGFNCDIFNNGIRGIDKLGPPVMSFVKGGLPISGSYTAIREGFWPITRDDRQCDGTPCDPTIAGCHRGSACVMDPDRGPVVGGQLGCAQCDGGPYFGTDLLQECFTFQPDPPNATFQCPDNIGPCGSPAVPVLCNNYPPFPSSNAGVCSYTEIGGELIVPGVTGSSADCFATEQPRVLRLRINRGAFTTLSATVSG